MQVGIDGGYVRNWVDKKRNFEVIVGKSTLSFGKGEEDETPWHKRCGFVQTYDGLDHRVGHLVSMTTSAKQSRDTVEGCNEKATSPSLANTYAKAEG